MILPTTVPPASSLNPTCTSVTNSDIQCSVHVATRANSVVVSTTSSSITQEAVMSYEIQCCDHDQSDAKPSGKEACCRPDACNGAQSGDASCKVDGGKVLNTESTNPESKIGDVKDNRTKNGEIKNGETKIGEVAAVKSDGDGGGQSEKEKEVIVLNDSLDDDFKQTKKRFRTPATSTKDGPVSYRHSIHVCVLSRVPNAF